MPGQTNGANKAYITNTVGVSVADGGNVAEGATSDVAYTSGNGSIVSILKGIFGRLAKGKTNDAGSLPVTLSSDQFSSSLPVRGTLGSGSVGVSGDTLGNAVRTKISQGDYSQVKSLTVSGTLSGTPNTWTLIAGTIPTNSVLIGLTFGTNGAPNCFLRVGLGNGSASNSDMFYGYVNTYGQVMFGNSAGMLCNSNNTRIWAMSSTASFAFVATIYYI